MNNWLLAISCKLLAHPATPPDTRPGVTGWELTARRQQWGQAYTFDKAAEPVDLPGTGTNTEARRRKLG